MHAFPPNNNDHVIEHARLARKLGLTYQRQRFIVRRSPIRPGDLRVLTVHAVVAVTLTGVAVFGFLDLTTR
jgi:hypothetical protein